MRSRTILPRIFKSLYFCLIGFWESWLFNYPLTFILSFPTLNIDMGPNGLPPWMYHEYMFHISTQSIEEIQSYWSASAGYRIWVLMVARENDLECFLMFWFNYIVTLEFPFAYPHVYKPLILTLWASFSPFIFGECERSLGVRAYLRFLRGKNI